MKFRFMDRRLSLLARPWLKFTPTSRWTAARRSRMECSHEPCHARNARNNAGRKRLVRSGLLRLHQHSTGWRMAVGGRSHPSSRARPGTLALASRRQPLDRNRLPAGGILAGHMDLGDSPIIDKKIGRWYLSFNPTLDRSFHGPGVNQGVEFSPNVKFSYDFTKKIAGGLEYYAAYGSLAGFDALQGSAATIFPSIDVDLAPQWEFNFGVGVGTTRSTDHLIVKCIVGRRFSWPHRASETAPDATALQRPNSPVAGTVATEAGRVGGIS